MGEITLSVFSFLLLPQRKKIYMHHISHPLPSLPTHSLNFQLVRSEFKYKTYNTRALRFFSYEAFLSRQRCIHLHFHDDLVNMFLICNKC